MVSELDKLTLRQWRAGLLWVNAPGVYLNRASPPAIDYERPGKKSSGRVRLLYIRPGFREKGILLNLLCVARQTFNTFSNSAIVC